MCRESGHTQAIRFFNTNGGVRPGKYSSIAPFRRLVLDDVLALTRSERYFVADMLEALDAPRDALVVMDRGIATEERVQWLHEHRYRYLVHGGAGSMLTQPKALRGVDSAGVARPWNAVYTPSSVPGAGPPLWTMENPNPRVRSTSPLPYGQTPFARRKYFCGARS